jgi:hypothetical protein
MSSNRSRVSPWLARLGATVLIACVVPPAAAAPSEGGLYIAGYEFDFDQAASRGLSQNPKGRRFFVLTLAPNAGALTASAPQSSIALRERVIRSNGVLLVCQRDIDSGRIDASKLAPGVVAVRGFPPRGSTIIPPGERYFPDENRAALPQSNEALRRLRATCS